MLDRKIISGTLGFIACVAFSSPLAGGELIPYRLPSERDYPPPQSSQSVQPRMQRQMDSREEYYWNFEQKAAGLSEPERKELIRDFSRKQKDAADEKRYDEAQHYLRLLEILSKGGNK